MTPKTMKSSLNPINRARIERGHGSDQGMPDANDDLGKNLLGSSRGRSPAVIGVGGHSRIRTYDFHRVNLHLIEFTTT